MGADEEVVHARTNRKTSLEPSEMRRKEGFLRDPPLSPDRELVGARQMALLSNSHPLLQILVNRPQGDAAQTFQSHSSTRQNLNQTSVCSLYLCSVSLAKY